MLQQRRQEILDDMTDATGAVFLGLTYGCARCHNHKFDPILQADYYRLQAFFANTAADDHIPDAAAGPARGIPPEAAPCGKSRPATSAPRSRPCSNPQRQAATQEYFDKYPPEIQAMILKPPAQRNPFEWQMFAKAKPYLEFADDDVRQTAARRSQARHTIR